MTGLLGVLIQAKQHNLIQSVKLLIDQLIEQADFRVSNRLYDTIGHLEKSKKGCLILRSER
ncbi:DUF3368 domain-containing protein [Pantanalinema rosaneae CENA516]|uniref:DUF3368 domain-containing protein n=1 Tax=Pantanalinema rosaneae TaxID=1620701 RepID=UPI003D6F630C